MFAAVTTILFGLFVAAADAESEDPDGKRGPDVRARCSEDVITDLVLANKRNQWANKCGYISEDELGKIERPGTYVTFQIGEAPCDADAPCVDPPLEYLGLCPLGCFAGGQEVLFGDNVMAIEEAGRRREPLVTGLDSGATLERLTTAEHPVARYAVGPTSRSLVCLADVAGHRVEVTGNHPMVTCDGAIVDAASIQVGDGLLGLDGCRIVASVVGYVTQADVWNLEPVTEDRVENTTVASGFVTGSLRFQNEWADELYRLTMRDRLSRADLRP